MGFDVVVGGEGRGSRAMVKGRGMTQENGSHSRLRGSFKRFGRWSWEP